MLLISLLLVVLVLGFRNIIPVNANPDAVMATINVGDSPVGIAVNPITNKIYVDNTVSNTVSVIDGSVPIPEFPNGSLVLVLLASVIATAFVIGKKYRNLSLK